MKILLGCCFALIVQSLFPIPGWIVAASVVGYNGNVPTPSGDVAFRLVMIAFNTILYFSIFYAVVHLWQRWRARGLK